MKKIFSFIIAVTVVSSAAYAKKGDDSLELAVKKRMAFIDSVNGVLRWQTNTVALSNGIAKLNISKDFKYLNAGQSQFVLHDLWKNPSDSTVLGMIFPADSGPFSDSSYAFIITYENDGYVKDDDADKIDYNAMLKDQQDAEKKDNAERGTNGYDPIHLVGWAEPPYYDKKNRVLHWAKELKFGDDSVNTLNYDVRVLGRKGVLSMNAVADMSQLRMVRASIDKILLMPQFTDGNKYTDFNSGTDKVAAYGIGTLVAGGILAKTGMLALIGKFLLAAWKFILIGLTAAWAGIKRFFTGRRKPEKDNYYDNVSKYKP